MVNAGVQLNLNNVLGYIEMVFMGMGMVFKGKILMHIQVGSIVSQSMYINHLKEGLEENAEHNLLSGNESILV